MVHTTKEVLKCRQTLLPAWGESGSGSETVNKDITGGHVSLITFIVCTLKAAVDGTLNIGGSLIELVCEVDYTVDTHIHCFLFGTTLNPDKVQPHTHVHIYSSKLIYTRVSVCVCV